MSRHSARLGLLWLLTFEIAAVVTLHGLGAVPGLTVGLDDPLAWLAQTPADEAVAATLRLVGLCCAWWLLATTLAYALATALRAPVLAQGVGLATLPAIRGLVHRAAAIALGASVVLGTPSAPAAAGQDVVRRSLGGSTIVAPVLPGDDGLATPSGWAAGTQEVGGGAAAPTIVDVAQGDHLWGIAGTRLAAARDVDRRELAPADLHPYWTEVVAANRDSLRSGDPDLIYPGERILLPEPAGQLWRSSTPASGEATARTSAPASALEPAGGDGPLPAPDSAPIGPPLPDQLPPAPPSLDIDNHGPGGQP